MGIMVRKKGLPIGSNGREMGGTGSNADAYLAAVLAVTSGGDLDWGGSVGVQTRGELAPIGYVFDTGQPKVNNQPVLYVAKHDGRIWRYTSKIDSMVFDMWNMMLSLDPNSEAEHEQFRAAVRRYYAGLPTGALPAALEWSPDASPDRNPDGYIHPVGNPPPESVTPVPGDPNATPPAGNAWKWAVGLVGAALAYRALEG